MKPRVSVALAFRENVVRSDGNGLGYIKKVLSYSAEKVSIVVATKKVHCHERMGINSRKEIT